MLKTGDIVLIRSKGFLPWAIRLITLSWFNHTETAKETRLSGETYLQLVGARAEGVVPAPVKDYLLSGKVKKIKVIRYDYCNETVQKEIYNQMVRLEGVAGYDYADLFVNYLISYIKYWFTGKWKWVGNKSTDKFPCWQLSQYFHQPIFKSWWDARAHEFEKQTNDLIFEGKPEDLCELLSL